MDRWKHPYQMWANLHNIIQILYYIWDQILFMKFIQNSPTFHSFCCREEDPSTASEASTSPNEKVGPIDVQAPAEVTYVTTMTCFLLSLSLSLTLSLSVSLGYFSPRRGSEILHGVLTHNFCLQTHAPFFLCWWRWGAERSFTHA